MFTIKDFKIEESDESAIIISLNLNQYIVKFIASHHFAHNYNIKVMGYDNNDTIKITDKDENSLLNKFIKKINIPETQSDREQRRHIVKNIFTKKVWYDI